MEYSSGDLFLAVKQKSRFKVVIVGESGTGKTSILVRYTLAKFADHKPTINTDLSVKNVQRGDEVIKLNIWDTGGQEQFHALTSQFTRDAHGIILVYDITDARSYTKLDTWMDLIKDQVERSMIQPAIILVGNKTDIREHRIVSVTQAEDFATRHNISYIEASAKEDTHVDALFSELISQMLKIRHESDEEETLNEPVYIKFNSPERKKTCC